MPRNCSVCRHPQRLQIEQALVSGTSLRDIAGRYGTAKTIIARHRTHVAGTIARQSQAQELVRTATLLEDVRSAETRAEGLYNQAERILANAIKDNDRVGALQAIKAAAGVMVAARGYLQLRGELTDELGRDRNTPMMHVQIICPSVLSAELAPRVTFVSTEAIESSLEDIGILQRP